MAVYPTAHPRSYLTPNRARLTAALGINTVAASRFRTIVDSWYAGKTIWGFEAWNGALLSQLSGNASATVTINGTTTTIGATVDVLAE